MLKETDSLIHRKGTTFIVLNQNGDLTKIEENGTRVIYPKVGGDTLYTAGQGLTLDDRTFSINYNDTNTAGKLVKVASDGKIPSGLYEKGGTIPYIAGDGLTLTDKTFSVNATIARTSDLPTKTSDLTNDSGYITTQQQTDPIFTSVSGTFALKTELFSGSYNDLTDKPTIPTALSQLTSDSSHRIVTDSEKATWNAKQNAITSDNKLDYSLLSNSPTIPTALSQLTEDSTHRTVTDQKKGIWDSKQDAITVQHKLSYNLLSNTPTIPTNLSQLGEDASHRIVTDVEKATWNAKANVEAYKLPATADSTTNWLGSGPITWTDTSIFSNSKKIIDLAYTNETYLNFPTISCTATQNFVRTFEVWIKMDGDQATGITSIFMPQTYATIGDLPTVLKGEDSGCEYTYHIFIVRFRANSGGTYAEVAYSHAFNTDQSY